MFERNEENHFTKTIQSKWNSFSPWCFDALFRFRSYWTLAMQKWQIFGKDFAKEGIEYPFLVMTGNANAIANAECERT